MVSTGESKSIGCIFGCAIGDAFGMPHTGRTAEEIGLLGGIFDFLPARDAAAFTIPLTALGNGEIEDLLAPGQWTDDTQLMLALAEALIEERGLFVPERWANGLVRWLNECPRSPGQSSLEAAMQLRTGGAMWDEAADPEGAGCGAATRVAPIGIVYQNDPSRRRRAAVLQALTTHGSADAHAAAIAVAEAVSYLMPLSAQGADWKGDVFLQTMADVVRNHSPDFGILAQCIDLARSLFEDEVDTMTAVRVLGVSAWSREAVPAALFLAARHLGDFELLLWNSVNLTGGAVESIAAITGALGGAYHGITGIPSRWRRSVEDGPRLLETGIGLSRVKIQE